MSVDAMVTIVRRLFWLVLVVGGGHFGWMFWKQRTGDDTDAAPEWPPLDSPSSATLADNVPNDASAPPVEPQASDLTSLPNDESSGSTDTAPPTAVAVEREPNLEASEPAPGPDARTLSAAMSAPDTTAAPLWVDPVDRKCPDGYPVKANDNSGIYHVPGGRFYDRTVPERCYRDVADAAAAGYRSAKS